MNNHLQNKLFQFEATPPAGVWDMIAEALDAEETFPQRLRQYYEQPPAQTWTRIEVALDQTSAPAKIIPFTARFKRPIRYAAAASIIAVVLVSTTLFMKRTEAGSVQAGSKTTVPVTEKQVPLLPAEKDQSSTSPITALQIQSEEPARPSRKILAFIRPQNIFASIIIAGRFMPKTASKQDLFDFSSANNYMVYSDGDGTAMKLPKKLFTLVSCRDGDGSCKERIRQLQQKLSSTSITADFMGMLDLLRQLQ